MRIVDLKSQNVKISYKPTEIQLKVGDFVSFKEDETHIIAQVLKINLTNDENNIAELSFLITTRYKKTALWRGEAVSSQAIVEKTSQNDIENFVNRYTNDIFELGSGNQDKPMRLSLKNFTSPAFIGYENQKDNIAMMKLFANQFDKLNKKLLIIDYNGNIEIENAKKITAGFQEKLPLDGKLLEKFADKMLENISIESKIVIEGVLSELALYAKDAPNGFISISHLIEVIDTIYKQSRISQLILLKNKLLRYRKLNLFADIKNDIEYIEKAFKDNNIVIFDLSNVPSEWKNDFAQRAVNSNFKELFLYLDLENITSDSDLLNKLIFKTAKLGIKPIFAANYRHTAIDKIINFAGNVFLFRTHSALKKYKYLFDILETLPEENFVIYGKLTAGLCLVSTYSTLELAISDEINNMKQLQENNLSVEIKDKNSDTDSSIDTKEDAITNIDMGLLNNALEPNFSDFAAINISKKLQEKPLDNVIEENTSDQEELLQPQEQEIQPIQEIIEDDEIISLDSIKDDDSIEIEQKIAPMQQEVLEESESNIENIDIQEESAVKIDTTSNIEDISEIEDMNFEELDFIENGETNSPQEFSADNDDNNLEDLLSESNNLAINDEESLSVEDINFDETSEAAIQKEEEKLPVYSADYENKEEKSNIEFNVGDLVKHNKYGLGTVTRITPRGNKFYCHVNFENIGRRLVDPEISPLQKIE